MPTPEATFFIDTSFHLAYFFKKEKQHAAARSSITKIRRTHTDPFFVTTGLVLQETISAVHRDKSIGDRYERAQAAIRLGRDILEFNDVYALNAEMFFQAWGLFIEKNQENVLWEFTDCSSFVFIREIRKSKYKPDNPTIRQVLSFDGHYHEAAPLFKFKVVC